MNQILTDKDFSTTDLALSTALLCFGHKLKRIDKTSPRAFFIFIRTAHLERDAERFWAGELQIEPKQFFNCQKEIKSRLYGTS